MPNYQNGKIYKIESPDGDMVYIGSTARQYLSQRMMKHRNSYNRWKKEKKESHVTAYDIFDKYGIENCTIVLLESFPCNSKDELKAREGEYIRNMECVNKVIPGRNKKEYYNDNKDLISENYKKYYYDKRNKILEIHKQYYMSNKEKILNCVKCYYENNKEKVLDYQHNYRSNNKEKIIESREKYYEKNKNNISEKRKEKMSCECGSIHRISDKAHHAKSKKHQNYLKLLEVVEV
jgi:hypothetical protein